MRVLGVAIPLAIALIAVPAMAEEAKNPEDKIVCKRAESTSYTGSHLSRPKKSCKKASEWREIEEDKNSTVRKLQDGRVNPNQPAALGGGPG